VYLFDVYVQYYDVLLVHGMTLKGHFSTGELPWTTGCGLAIAAHSLADDGMHEYRNTSGEYPTHHHP
jgi:hypothetical protein